MTAKTWEELYGAGAVDDLAPVGIDAETLTKLLDMEKHELIALIHRVAGAMWGICLKSDDEVYRAGMDRLARLILTLPDAEAKTISTVFDRWADRYKGKPAMTVNQNFTMTLEQLVLQSYVDAAGVAKTIDHSTI